MVSSGAVRIGGLAAGGDGVGRLPDGRAVFVPRTAPGDLVTLRDLRPAKRFARARIEQVLESSPDRVDPPCPHYTQDDCGGCQLQHLSAGAQLAARRRIAGDALRRLARLDVPDPEIEPADNAFGYRAKLTLAASRRRIGLHRSHRASEVFDLIRCYITDDRLNALWGAVQEARHLLPRSLEHLVLRLDRSGGRHLIAEIRGSEVWTNAPALAAELERRDAAATLWWRPEGGVARVLAGPPSPAAPVAAFEQIHHAMGDRIRAYAVERLGSLTGRSVWDLYAGIGETTTKLVAAGARVTSVEADRRAVGWADTAGPPATRHAAKVEDIVDRLERPDLVVTNPPRSGMDPRAADGISRSGAGTVVYISCDPATLARDLVRLGQAYRLAEARCFDLFPQTAHVETVAVLARL